VGIVAVMLFWGMVAMSISIWCVRVRESVCRHLSVHVQTCVCVCVSERERVCVCRYCGGDAAQLFTVLGDGGNVH